ncbi:hypothetical protein ISP15_14715 [Dyella jejuensis]|uniref:Transmembrane protein n=1 Tax=Dyella jejuensis TaxID=1432009 RepID=A0ABW8JKD8_9GAMM
MADVVVAQMNTSESRFASVSFRAVFAGWLVATGIVALLYLGGLALGFSFFNAWDLSASAKGIGAGTAIWLVLSWIVALWLGGMFASWTAAHDDRTVGTLHGATVWGLSVTAAALWLALGLAAHGRGPSGGNAPPPPPSAEAPMASGPQALLGNGSLAVLQADVTAHLNAHDRAASGSIVAALLAGRDDVAANLFAANNGTSSADGARILATIAPDVQAARMDAKSRADRAAHYAACALWILFLSVFLGLIAAVIGGHLGAGHVHRVYHLRAYNGNTVRTGLH